jgi:hypothetical protein
VSSSSDAAYTAASVRLRRPSLARIELTWCAIPLSDANLNVARLDLPAGELGAAWLRMTRLEQELDDPAAVGG